MKISYMLKREDFYKINEQTLQSFFKGQDNKETTLFIYPHLNAIIKRIPSKEVKQYIYTEYSVTGSLLKKLFVWGYTRLCLNTLGLFSARKIKIPAEISSHVLIYPCNRKFRIFDFKENTVSVITKSGFSNKSLQNEIEFRTKCKPCNFILPIESYTDKTYTELIINGIPLARLCEGRDLLEQKALKLWHAYSADSKQTLKVSQYALILQKQIVEFTDKITSAKPCVNIEKTLGVVNNCLSFLKSSDIEVEIIQSHGDLQRGNIWIENKTGQIYIIDWESVQQRSIWYDEAVLYDDIRKTNCFDEFTKVKDIRHTVVILEEIIYRMNELCELPFDYGTNDFNFFISKLEK